MMGDKAGRPGGLPMNGAQEVSAVPVGIPDADTLEAALFMAELAHRGQRDKGGEPYLFHPIRVSQQFSEPRRRIVALLHDVLEDSGFTEQHLRSQFGDEITDAVLALTRRDGEDYESFIERCGVNDIARGVKSADLWDNMNMSRIPNPTDKDRARLEKYRKARGRLMDIALAAQGTEAQRAETGTGSVHDGPVGSADASTPGIQATPTRENE